MRYVILGTMGLALAATGLARAEGLSGVSIAIVKPTPIPAAATQQADVILRTRMDVAPGGMIRTISGHRAAFYLTSGEAPAFDAEVSLYVDETSAIGIGPADAAPQIDVQGGSAVVHGVTVRPVVVRGGDSWVRLEPAPAGPRNWSTLRVRMGPAGPQFTLSAGAATRFAGAVPEKPETAQGGAALKVESDPAAVALVRELNRARVLAEPDEWLSRAERGDLTPGPQSGAGPAPTPPPELRLPAPVTQAQVSAPVTVTQVTAPAAVTSAFTQAQQLLASQNPASVVVGARLERTRIVGNPGATGLGVGVGANQQTRIPFTLGARRR